MNKKERQYVDGLVSRINTLTSLLKKVEDQKEYVDQMETTMDQMIEYTQMLETTIRTTNISLELGEIDSAKGIVSTVSEIIVEFINNREYKFKVQDDIDEMLNDIGCK